MQDLDVVGIDAELVGNDHRPRRLVALPVRGRAGDDLDLAGWQEADDGVLPPTGAVVQTGERPARGQATDLDVGAQSDAELLGVTGCPALGLLGSRSSA